MIAAEVAYDMIRIVALKKGMDGVEIGLARFGKREAR